MRPTRKRNLKLIVAVAVDPRPQYAIAYEAAMWPQTFSQIKQGFRQPSVAQQQAIAAALGMSVAELFDDVQVAS